jgi:hypothetical protein
MKFTQAAIAAAFAMTVAVPLSAQTYVAEKLVKSVNQDELIAIVGSLGHQVKGQGEAADNIYVAAEDEEGTTYLLFGTACQINDVPGCQGVMMQVRYDLPATTTFETLASANFGQAAINIWADFEDKTLGFTRYHVLDHGVTMANIRENINVLLELVAESYPVAAGE